MAERLRNRLQSDSIPVRIWILAFFLNYLINLNYILRSTFNKFMQCQGGGTATQSPAERFHSSSNLDLGFLLNFPILFPKYLISLSFLFFSLLERRNRPHAVVITSQLPEISDFLCSRSETREAKRNGKDEIL